MFFMSNSKVYTLDMEWVISTELGCSTWASFFVSLVWVLLVSGIYVGITSALNIVWTTVMKLEYFTTLEKFIIIRVYVIMYDKRLQRT